MPQNIEATITELKRLLPYVARDAKRYENPTDLVKRSHELSLATLAINETIPHPSFVSLAKGPFIRVQIGSKAVETLGFRKLAYDMRETTHEIAEPGQEFNLLFKKEITTDPRDYRYTQFVYGHMQYFDIASLGQILEDGGDLVPTEPGSS